MVKSSISIFSAMKLSCKMFLLLLFVTSLEVHAWAFAGGPICGDKIPKIVALTEGTMRGVLGENNAEIIQLFDSVATENQERSFSDALVSGRWKLLWTTEKETLFFAKNGLFGKSVTEISQTIDLKTGFLNNLIEFEGDRAFSVEGTIEQNVANSSSSSSRSGRRLDFKFKSATLSVPPLLPALRLPPVGAGWFENVYVNRRYRLSRDVRGDYLLSERV